MKNKPPYAIESVDNALCILQTLRDSGQVRVSDVAAELGIARSTAHRLLSMLVYRDFAVKTDDHSYLPGPALSAPPLRGEPAQRLRQALRPHMETLCERVEETVNLMVRLGAQTRFLHTVECARILRVGDRQGTILPAWQTSGGKVLLAELPDAQLTAVLRGTAGRGPDRLTDAERRTLVSELRTVRDQGYAENIEESESGVCAVGVCVRDGAGEAVAALSISAPSVRYTPDRAQVFIRELRAAISAISLLTTVVIPMPSLPATQLDAVTLAADGCRALAAAGQADMVWGHPSVRDPEGRGVWMKESGWGFEEVDESRIVLVSPQGEVLAGDGPRHIEYPIHTEIMAARADVGAVVHTHSAGANAFAALGVPLRPLDHAGSLFCYPDIPRFTLTGGLIKTPELGAALADALGDAVACLMPQHGIVAVGADLPAAVMTAVLLDRACRTQLTAMAAGPLASWGDEQDTVAKRADVWSEKQLHAGWNYLLRQA